MRIVGCFLEYNGKFVILRRHSHKPNGNTWGLPAGKVEPGENDAEAILREVYEETGYRGNAQELGHLGDFEFTEGDSKYTFATYLIKLAQPHSVILESNAHSDFKWVTAEECYAIPNLIDDFHDLLKKLKFINPSSDTR